MEGFEFGAKAGRIADLPALNRSECSLLFAVIDGPVQLDRCLHALDWTWSAPLSLALQVAQ